MAIGWHRPGDRAKVQSTAPCTVRGHGDRPLQIRSRSRCPWRRLRSWHRRLYPEVHLWLEPGGPCSAPGYKAGSGRRARKAGHQENVGPGLDLVREQVSEKPRCTSSLPGYAQRPVFRAGHDIRGPFTEDDELDVTLQQLSATSISRFHPFWWSSRPIWAKSGTSGRTGEPERRWRASFAFVAYRLGRSAASSARRE